MRKIFLMMGLILLSLAGFAAKEDFDPHFWTGHLLHGDIGFVADEIRHSLPIKSKIIIRGNAAFYYGYEYGYQFADNWYVGGGLEWQIAYPRNFHHSLSTSRRLVFWLQPLTHARIGYVFDNHVMLSLGITYLWALNLNLKMPMNDHVFVEFQYVQWLDEFLGLPKLLPTLLAAIDFANFGVGVGYKF